MPSFHRTKRESRVLGFIALAVAFFLAMIFMLLGFYSTIEEGRASIELIFGFAGLALFVICIRGAWMMTGRALIHVFSLDQHKVVWGFMGKEKQLDIQDVTQIYWDDSDSFQLQMTTKEGAQVRFPYIANVVGFKSRPELLRFFKTNLPAIPLGGHIDKATEEAALAKL